jgi:hypothetical protein
VGGFGAAAVVAAAVVAAGLKFVGLLIYWLTKKKTIYFCDENKRLLLMLVNVPRRLRVAVEAGHAQQVRVFFLTANCARWLGVGVLVVDQQNLLRGVSVVCLSGR